MPTMIVTVILGIFLCVLGGVNMTGNVSSLHSYHRKRVREEDKKPFGRLVGIGNIIIGLSLVAMGVLNYLAEQSASNSYTIAGMVVLIAGLVVGLGINFFAMIKYNKGIF